MNAYDRIMRAKDVDDIPIMSHEWMIWDNMVVYFSVVGHHIGNVIAIERENGDRKFMTLDDFKRAVEEA
jgi:hypothetical protein